MKKLVTCLGMKPPELTHWLSFSEYAQDQEGLQQEKYDQKDQGDELVKRV